MRKNLRIPLSVFALYSGLLACTCGRPHERPDASPILRPEAKGNSEPAETRNNCVPTFVTLSSESVRERIDPYLEFSASIALIGCSTSLDAIDERGKLLLVNEFRQILRENHYFLERRRLEPGFRAELTERANSVLGNRLVDDVLVYGFGSTEYERK